MSQLNVNTIGARTGNDISIASGKTLKDASGNAFITSGGINGFQQFRLTADLSGNATYVTSNWEEIDTDYEAIGSYISESSGVFSFSATGKYLISGQAELYAPAGGYANFLIDFTRDNSSYTTRARGSTSGGGNRHIGCTVGAMFDVTDTSTHKCKFNIQSGENGWTAYVRTNRLDNVVTFTRLGDT